jgi:DNA mismatch repair protein MutS2
LKTLDLHGRTTEEAIDIIDRFLFEIQQKDIPRAKIITGKGSGKIHQTTIQYLKQAGYKWQYERMSNGKENTGVLIIFGN